MDEKTQEYLDKLKDQNTKPVKSFPDEPIATELSGAQW